MQRIGYGHSSGTLYYGNGSSGYLRGSSVTVTKQGNQIPYTLYISTGGVYRALGSTGYYAGSSATYYQGNGGYVTGRGSAVDAIEWNGTLYEAGSSVTPIGTGVSGLYQRNAEDDTTFVAIGGACSLKPATLTTREITALTV